MRSISVIILIVAASLASCTEPFDKESKKQAREIESGYPAVVDSLNMRKQYDEAKWVLYCFNCDDTCKFFKETGITDTTITFGMLDLKFDRCLKKHDTVDLDFYFYYHDTLKCDVTVCRTRSLTGLAYKIGSQDYFAIVNVEWGNYFWKPSYTSSRLFNPLQSGVIRYIKENRERLSPWFYNEAKRRGIIQQGDRK